MIISWASQPYEIIPAGFSAVMERTFNDATSKGFSIVVFLQHSDTKFHLFFIPCPAGCVMMLQLISDML